MDVIGVLGTAGNFLRTVNAGDTLPDQRTLVRCRPVIFCSLVGHYAPPFAVFAACRTAAHIPAYVPQRQKLPPSCCLICSSVGFGYRSSSAFVAMTNPGVQKPHCCASLSTNACWIG